MGYETIATQLENRVLTITLQRPPVNALSLQMLEELTSAFEEEARLEGVGAVVVAGAGRTFAAGADIKSFAEHDPDAGAHPSIRVGNDLFNLIEAYDKAVIAAVNGACLGGGNELAMACDFRIASSAASFGQPEIKLGLVPGWGGLQRLPRLIGRGWALDQLLTGRTNGAEEAREIGLVHEVVAPDQLLSRALALARALAGMAPLAVAHTKERVARGLSEKQGQAVRDDEWAFHELLGSEDGREGLRAFLEKREPRWQGR